MVQIDSRLKISGSVRQRAEDLERQVRAAYPGLDSKLTLHAVDGEPLDDPKHVESCIHLSTSVTELTLRSVDPNDAYSADAIFEGFWETLQIEIDAISGEVFPEPEPDHRPDYETVSLRARTSDLRSLARHT